MKPILLLLILLLIASSVFAQDNVIAVEAKQNPDKSVTILYRKNAFGTYYLKLDFTTLENSRSTGFRSNIKGQSGTLIKLSPIDESRGISYGYKYSTIRGELNPDYNPDFVYLLPLSTNISATVRNLSSLDEEYFEADRPENWTAYQFLANPGDTVFASRKGQVVKVVQDKQYNQKFELAYQSNVNYILVEHPDGTMARYAGFGFDEIIVEEGQMVFPRSALGKLAQYDNREKGQLRFYVYYLTNVDFDRKAEKLKDKFDRHAYIDPLFLTEDGIQKLEAGKSYRSVASEKYITAEFSRKEKKKYVKAFE